MDTPIYFYHNTSHTSETAIREDDILEPQVYNPPQNWMRLVSHPVHVPDGVFFCATLYFGDLPTISPYGERRVRIPIDDVLRQLGGNVKLYSGEPTQAGNNTYVRMMLVKEDDDFDVLQHMKQENIASNQWLRLAGGYQVACRPTWVYIYVPYPISVKGCSWDTVKLI
ncbi:uncharacterized protein LOC132555545 isoform X1 [Ylistrum balloti]|uniref:uncharacterized protein LOC132555545 isoform X1 n=1 Tax=Ylistrum balloti TaxID=509963 RepID=UPI002905E34D|nr:uncharacterized protein LOC132555545 isoform X1 [Ylistrum balloti]